MGRHVPAIGQQRHRAEIMAGGDFAHHHQTRKGKDELHPSGIAGMVPAAEIVILVLSDVTVLHGETLARQADVTILRLLATVPPTTILRHCSSG